ncbi:MAG: hypothetical protein FD171_548 [Actinobacteria bacterium]|nr:MAG: hypothetical protein FD171_548 [Actinomycetota bacterium]
MSSDDPRLRDGLLDLRDAGHLVAMVVAETDRATYAESPTGSLALERAVSNFGEAASRLHSRNPDFEARHPELEIGNAIKTRAVIVHNYDGIDRRLLWDTAIADVPRVTGQVEALLGEYDGTQ